MNGLNERLKKARLEKGISQKELATRIGRSQSAIAALESGRNKESTNIATIAQVLGVDPVWLEIGNGQMKNAYKSDEMIYENQARNGFIQFKKIDLFADSENEIRLVEISEEWVRKNIGNDFKNTFIITAPDDSMYPTFSNGDLLFVNIAIKCHRGDGVYLIATPKSLLVKRIQATICGDLKIISDNKNYAQEIISPAKLKSIHIYGKIEAAFAFKTL
ncbi:hypothetical protein BGI15_07795 [Snodgrassella alvi]|uniref:XRE family transcriptional regulator n=1 Tax=Snodgrassella alvi TaxID=1196083 RepID=UPI0009FBE92D|nr:LexA family transcriptional regulator [Snodgrassella alvi]ORE99543.1 hypothetical protein BGH96_10575 [Snodgrassella alvi]ORF24567.1 hypothetical protein BGI07_07370 [Snodgrassella alvi]ORF31172.1 hypothetical protein BGI10_06055 [Snodgrassella alvi]ORF33215.1 hypothetical protein BGI11_08810 [Snodgrassella alvi]ORF37188.1 hypothetical protein BGI13_08765 [Snodgrassella alvi]